MDAQRFRSEFIRALVSASLPAQNRGALQWTDYVREALVSMAEQHTPKLHVCAHGLSPTATSAGWHEGSEHLYDFTLYDHWDEFSLPCVIVEHENQWNEREFFRDFWKLLLGWAALRVMIGYAKTETEAEVLAGKVKHLSSQGLRYPQETEDLVMIGRRGMDVERGWTVLVRPRGQTVWTRS